jgi:hypothetical protein
MKTFLNGTALVFCAVCLIACVRSSGDADDGEGALAMDANGFYGVPVGDNTALFDEIVEDIYNSPFLQQALELGAPSDTDVIDGDACDILAECVCDAMPDATSMQECYDGLALLTESDCQTYMEENFDYCL